MQDMLAEDHTNIIDLLINQMFPINLVGILIERIESFSSSMHWIQKFLMSSLKDLNSIFIDSEMSDKKDNNQHRENLMEIDDFMELFPNNYKTIYRTVFLYRILAKLSERYLLQDLLLVAKDFILEVRILINITLIGCKRFWTFQV